MIEIVTKSGKKIGKISDSLDGDDSIVVNGQEIKLSDAYSNDTIKNTFNTTIKSLKDDAGKNNNT